MKVACYRVSAVSIKLVKSIGVGVPFVKIAAIDVSEMMPTTAGTGGTVIIVAVTTPSNCPCITIGIGPIGIVIGVTEKIPNGRISRSYAPLSSVRISAAESIIIAPKSVSAEFICITDSLSCGIFSARMMGTPGCDDFALVKTSVILRSAPIRLSTIERSVMF